jgi:tRNA(His) 5'-end guanylyltransferase
MDRTIFPPPDLSYQVTRGDRMKAYEMPWKQVIPSKSYVIIRVDGKAFHSYTRDRQRPFDSDLMYSMDKAARFLCEQVQGAVFAYVQSDEISLLLTDFNANQEQWFGGSVQKMASVAASVATAGFNHADHPDGVEFAKQLALFDARVFMLPSHSEVLNYFLWRQRDCFVNAISMIASCYFSEKQLLHKSTVERLEMLDGVGVSVEQYPENARQGRVVTREPFQAEIAYMDRRTQKITTTLVTRHKWVARTAPWFDWDEAGFLQERVPQVREDQ